MTQDKEDPKERLEWELECLIKEQQLAEVSGARVDGCLHVFLRREIEAGKVKIITPTATYAITDEMQLQPTPPKQEPKFVEWTEDVRHVDDEMIRRTPSDLVVIPSHRKVKYRCPEWQVLAYDRTGRPISFRVKPDIEEVSK